MEKFVLKKPINHIAFIMDGNGRWAKKRLMPRTYGHKVACSRIIDIMLSKLFEYLKEFFDENIKEFTLNKCRIQVMGDISALPLETQKTIKEAIEITKNFDDYVFNICLNYGGRQEIVRAAKLAFKDIKEGKIKEEDLNIDTFKNYLYSSGLPEVDLMIRTSGEKRLSNFLLYQLAYSEFIFTDTYWPDFTPEKLIECLKEYESRDRRFGSIKE